MPAFDLAPGDLVSLAGFQKVPRTRPGVVLKIGVGEFDNWAHVQWHEPGQTGGVMWTQWHPLTKLSVVSTT